MSRALDALQRVRNLCEKVQSQSLCIAILDTAIKTEMEAQPVIETGGFAFPQPVACSPMGDLLLTEVGGMTLRNYVAAKAMAGRIANLNILSDTKTVGDCEDAFVDLAAFSYRCADAMLAAATSATPRRSGSLEGLHVHTTILWNEGPEQVPCKTCGWPTPKEKHHD